MARITLTPEEIELSLTHIRYRDWIFKFDGPVMELYVQFTDSDRFNQQPTVLKSRRWRVSKYATKSEVVQTALLAVLTAEEHEARERFLYKGAPIFGPHFDVEALKTICSEEYQDVRPEPCVPRDKDSIFL